MKYKQESAINVVQEIKSQTLENVLIVSILLTFLVWNLCLHLSQLVLEFHPWLFDDTLPYFYKNMSKYQHLNQTKKMIVSLAVHIDCFACASCFLSAILACSHPFLRRQLSGHTIDTMLFTCRLSMHSPSLCIEGHVPTSYCITTDPSALLTP